MSIAGKRVVAQTLGVLLRLEAAAAPHRQGCRPPPPLCDRGDLEPLRVDDIEDDALLSELLRGPPHLVFEGLDAAVRPLPSAPVTLEIEIPPPIHTRFLRPGSRTGAVRDSRSRPGFSPARKLRACALASMSVSSWLRAISTAAPPSAGRPRTSRRTARPPSPPCPCRWWSRAAWRSSALVDAPRSELASSVKSCRTRSPPLIWVGPPSRAARRERLEEFHRHRAHAHAVLDRRVQLVQQQRRDVARRSGREFHAVGEEPGAGAAMAFGSADGPPSYLKIEIGRDLPPSSIVKSSSFRSVTGVALSCRAP